MKLRRLIPSLLRIGLACLLLLSSGGRLLAQDVDGQPPDSAETAAMPLPAEFSAASATEGEIDPNAASVDEVLEEDRGDTSLAGPGSTDDLTQFDGIDNPDLDEESLRGGSEVDENGEIAAPFAGEHRLFIPSIMADGVKMDAEIDLEAAEGSALGAASGSVMGDFNGDGRSDLAIGVSQEDLVVAGSTLLNAGAINVIYGAATGLNATGNQVWTQNSSGIADRAEQNDYFGSAQAAGDFNGDGHDDLAIGVPYESNAANKADLGAVHVLYGSAAGLAAAGSQFWTQDTPGVLEVAEVGDKFGKTLAAGDFNGDGWDDLAIGAIDEALNGIFNAGVVHVLYGSAAGLSANGNQVWSQSTAGILDTVEAGDHFGQTLAAGDFDANGSDDLVIGVPYEDVGELKDAGIVQIIHGSAAGLAAAGNQLFSENTAGILGDSEATDRYGWALAAGDFNGNGAADLAIGVPNEDFGSLSNAGTVNVLYGAGGAGLRATGNQVWSQDSAGILETAEINENFGYALAAARFNAGAASDLAIGVPYEDLPGKGNAGAVNVLYGPLGTGSNQLWTQDSAGVLDAAEGGDNFGLALAAGDFNGNARADLVISVPFEDLGSVGDMGAVNVIYGPLAAAGNQFWSQDSPGIFEVGEQKDYFGNFNRPGQ